MFTYQDIFRKFESLEQEFLKINSELPGDWLLHSSLVDKVKEIDVALISNLNKLEFSEAGELERRINSQFSALIQKIKRYLFFLEEYLRKVKSGKSGKELKDNILDSIKVLSETLHLLLINIHQYPVNELGRRKILRTILHQMRLSFMLPPDINYQDAKKLISHFIGEELILVVRYNTNEKPYLVITRSQGRLNMHILKRTSHNYGLIASKLMALLGIRHMIIDTKRKLVDGKVQHLNSIEKIEGIEVLTLRKISNQREALAISFLIGAACADGFSVNLSDRPWNMYIDYHQFRRVYRKNYKHCLGARNPIFHVDYEQLDIVDEFKYLRYQYFGFNGIFIELLIRMIDFKLSRLTAQQIVESFNEGYLSELRYIGGFYRRNRSEINMLLAKNGLADLALRFSERSYPLLVDIEKEVVPKLLSQLKIA